MLIINLVRSIIRNNLFPLQFKMLYSLPIQGNFYYDLKEIPYLRYKESHS